MPPLGGIAGTPAAMLGAGILVVLFGGWLAWGSRLRRGLSSAPADTEPPGAILPVIGRISEATRLLTAFLTLLLGYHLIVWSFSPDLTPLQFPRDRWWAIVAVALVAIVISVALDRRSAGSDHPS